MADTVADRLSPEERDVLAEALDLYIDSDKPTTAERKVAMGLFDILARR